MNTVSAVPYADGPRLLADVGATNIRLALEIAPDQFSVSAVLPCAEHDSLEHALQAFLATAGHPVIRHAALSLPNPITGDHIKLTNHPWAFSVEAMRRHLDLQTLLAVNDYTALAMGLTRLEPQERVRIGGGEAAPGGVIGVIGPGSGLGVSALVPFQDRNVALITEGGHVSYPPQDADEAELVALATQRFGHASGERLISASGLELTHELLASRSGLPPPRLSAPEISARAQATPADPVALRALEMFCAMLGTVAGNLALTLGSTGGVYIGGGIVPQMLPFLARSAFRQRFESKGRFRSWLERVPTWVAVAPRSALRGASAMLDDHLTADHGAGPLLVEIRAAMDRLSTSERTVAQDLLSAPRAWMSDSIARIAERCGVSTPTVMRFCRSMGFKGLADFKLRLGSGLSGTTKVAHREVQHEDPTAERIGKIFDNSISALIALRDRLHPAAFERATAALAGARRIEIYGTGSSALTAEDAQNKLGRLGLAALARTDAQLQNLTSIYLGTGDVLLVLSNSGALESVNEAVARARRAGTTVITMCPQRSELARLADIVLPVDHPDDVHALVPMLSRLAQTVMIDALVSDLALQRRDAIGSALAHQNDQRFVTLSSHSRFTPNGKEH
ncbi:RpiR family transcriptional regulator [Sphaerotilus hippei]|uniref:Glucokinase n=1 Tax=Sphaerotilus hippei TaxID=744406 RepID=A0A318H1I0_9BURK|nr:glucokinase [Sphaerotilus hippei]PXW96682.1 RpiR family transcriptional regulator [Sphaerotilus hippei]